MKSTYFTILKTLWACSLLLFTFHAWAQDNGKISGQVFEKQSDGGKAALAGASVYWLGTTKGTATDPQGRFTLNTEAGTQKLIISFVGFKSDTIVATPAKSPFQIVLESDQTLEEVTVVEEQNSTTISFKEAVKIEQVSEKELLKAACCNLSESFETLPSVDVSFTDAVTGVRQIQMLGLSGPYTQVTRENMPNVRGLAANYGLTYTPGTWVEGMQLIKGMGSVVNGFESVAGQINVELRQPETADKLYFNAYGNEMGRMEANLNLAQTLKNKDWSTALLLHTSHMPFNHDRNDDGFLDNTRFNDFIGLNRWKYIGANGLMGQFGIKYTRLSKTGGQLDYERGMEPTTSNPWGMESDTRRVEGWAKIGKVFLDMPWKSYGLQLSATAHEQDNRFGLRNYQGSQQSLYANFIYQSILWNTNHTFKTGVSWMYDHYDEQLVEQSYGRTESVPGAFFEYNFQPSDNFSAVAGLRTDYHNLFGFFATPRLQLRYAPAENTILRFAGGRGQRTANIIAENRNLLASSRAFMIAGDDPDAPYGLQPEVAWNYGVNATQYFSLLDREATVSVDFYRTDFQNQIVVDLDRSPQAVHFYNLEGESFSNSLQVQADWEMLPRLDLRLAYRWFDVRTTYSEQLLEKPLVSTHRAFANFAYSTPNKWAFDLTVNWQGSRRLPFTGSNPEQYQLPGRSPDFLTVNWQVSKGWGRTEVYLGMENAFNFRQEAPILASAEPFSPFFDSTLVWGPIFGRNTYAGLRYRIGRE